MVATDDRAVRLVSAVVLHASGFVRDGKPTGVSITSYAGTIENIAPGIVAKIRSHGHEVKVTITRPLGGGACHAVELEVIVDPTNPMWHVFTYAGDQWPSD